MNILLMQSARLPGLKDTRSSIPLSLLVIAASLRENGHTPHIIDFSTMDVPSAKNSDERTAYFLKYFQPVIDEHSILLVGITCFSTMHYPLTTELAQIVKTSNPSVKIATGGAHPTYFGKDILTHDQNIDFVAEGEGEDTFVLLADLIEAESKGEECEFTIKDIQALKYREEDLKVSENVRVSYKKDVQQAAMPAWDLIDLDGYTGDFSGYYNPKNIEFNMTPPIFTSRSCPFTCSFCSSHLIMGRKYEKKTPVQVVDEMEYLYAERGQRYFAFMDDIINISVEHVVGLCDEITRRNMDIHISINQGLYIALVEKEMVDALAAVGLATVSLPIEHGDENIRMSVLNKRLKDEQIHKVVEWIKPHDIFTLGLFIMGFPEETRETLNKSMKMMEDLQLDVNATSSLIPFPRTDVHDQAVRDGLLLIDTDEVWNGKEYFDPTERGGFFIQPYNLSMDVLLEYRKIFNDMYFFSERAKSMNAPNSLVSTGETVAS